MTYNPNIPQANDDPTASQADLLGNFGKLNTDWSINHVPLTSGGNNGMHRMVQFPNVLGSDPSVVDLQSAIYPKLGPDSLPALFFKNASKVYQLTNLPVTAVATNNGINTPFGFIINAGVVASGTTTVTFAIPFSAAQVYTIEMTQKGFPASATSFIITTLNTSAGAVIGFNFSTVTPSDFYYFAIGK